MRNIRISSVYIIIFINICVYIVSLFLGESNALYWLGAKINPLIVTGDYFRVITSSFSHGGIFHLLMNMFALYYFGGLMEQVLGTRRFIVLYFTSALAGGIASFVFVPHVSVGASGAIFGLLGASIYFAYIIKEREMGKSFLSMLMLNILYGFIISNIDMASHIGGLIAGLLTMNIFVKSHSTANLLTKFVVLWLSLATLLIGTVLKEQSNEEYYLQSVLYHINYGDVSKANKINQEGRVKFPNSEFFIEIEKAIIEYGG